MNKTRMLYLYLSCLALTMGAALSYGFIVGDFWVEGGQLTDMPWGIVSLIDVYVGFLLFCCWIWYRERSITKKAILTIAILLGGNFVSALYALWALFKSGGNTRIFFLGEGERSPHN